MKHTYFRGGAREGAFSCCLLWLLLTGTLLRAQTTLVKDIVPGGGNPYFGGMVAVNGTLFFAVDDQVNGAELWKSDGTAGGTTLVKDLSTGATNGVPNSSSPSDLTAMNGKLYFSALGGLYRSDGTVAGTVLLKSFPGRPSSLENVNGTLYFAADEAALGRELWKSDGTPGGTVLVKDIAGGSASSNPDQLINANGMLYFSALGGLYKSNGTAGGTTLVKNFPGAINQFTNLNGVLYFTDGHDVWRSNGTPSGTVVAAAVPEGQNPDNTTFSGDPRDLTASGDKVYFLTTLDYRSIQLWAIGAAGGGVVETFTSLSYPTFSNLADVNGTLYFGYGSGSYYKGLYSTSGSGISQVKDLGRGFPETNQLTNVNGLLYFAATLGDGQDESGHELWRSDGSDAGTFRVADINPSSGYEGGSFPEQLINVNGVLFFTADDGTRGRELWKHIPMGPPSPTLRLNAGGPEYIATQYGYTYSADKYASGGSVGKLNTSPNIADTDLDTLFYTERWGTFSYSIPVNPGAYSVNLLFTEFYWGNLKSGGVGSRKFNVDIEGRRMLTNYDIFAEAGGALKTTASNFTVDVTDGFLNINFLPGTADQPKVSAIEIIPVTNSPENNPPVLRAIGNKTVTAGQTLSFSATATDMNYPPQNLVFSLTGAVPAGASISSSSQTTYPPLTVVGTGNFTWTPTQPGTYTFTVKVTDDGYPIASDEEQITVTVQPAAATALRINAGGNAFSTIDGRSYAGDTYFSGGIVSASTSKDIAGTADDYLYQTGRHGASFSYNVPTGNGSFDVVLHFAETYFGNGAAGGVGARRFNVNMEGTRKLTDYDIFARAGGPLKVAQETFRVTVSDGTLNIAFLKGAADNPAVKAFEVLPAGSALSLNSGGGSFTTAGGKAFSADSYYAGGNLSGISSGDILNTTDDGLYRNARVGAAFSYGIPSGNGSFDVVLHFAETYFGNGAAGGVGARRFNVDMEGARRLTNYDIIAKAGGPMRAVKETVRVTVSDGVLNLYFAKGSADNPTVSAIEVLSVTAPARIAADDSRTGEDWQVSLYPNPVRDKLTVKLPFPAAQVKATAVTDASGIVHISNAHQATGEDQLQLEAQALPKGFYLLRLDTHNGSKVLKFLKQ